MTFKPSGSFSFLSMLALARRREFDPAQFRGQIELDFSDLTFAGPDAMSCIKALLARAQRDSPPEACFPMQHRCQDAIRYLSRMDFFSPDIRWCMPPEQEQFVRHASEGRFLPIRNLHLLSETDAASREIGACLEAEDRASTLTLQYAISELIDNALQHSSSPAGAFVTAQKYGKTRRVHALIADTGIGIRRHLVQHPRFRDLADDVEAIRTALTPFVTGTYLAAPRDERREYENQGLGLPVIE